MKKLLVIILLSCASPLMAQSSLDEVLRSVETNNLSLRAARKNVDVQSLEARMGNTPEDPSVGYENLWGSPSDLGRAGELTISQAFDFPTVYARRGRVAANLSDSFENEYLDLRQQILLETQSLYIELSHLKQIEKMLNFRLDLGDHLFGLFDRHAEHGDLSLADRARMNHEIAKLQQPAVELHMRIIEIGKRLQTLNGGEPLKVDGTDTVWQHNLRPMEDVIRDYETYAPSLLAYQLQEQGAEYDLRLSRSMAIPKFELGYKMEYGTVGRERFNGVTVGMSIPLFSNRHNVKRAKAAQIAAQLDTQAAKAENAVMISELYDKADFLHETLLKYDLFDTEAYKEMLEKMFNASEINIVDYFIEICSLYEVAEAKIQVKMQYLLTLARINMIYL